MIEKAKQGVEVRLLIDAVGSHNAPEEKIEVLRQAGGKVEFFRPVNFKNLTRVHRRNHIRAIVIDGTIGYTGGLAFRDEWLSDGKQETGWRDLMFKYSGSLARATQDHFTGLWRQTNGEILAGKKFYPIDPAPTPKISDPYFVSLLHSPAPDVAADLIDLIWLAMKCAEKRIYLATPYLTPPKEILEVMHQARKRGVDIQVIVPGPHTDTPLVMAATRAHYEEMLRDGIKIYEYQPGRFHEKWLVVDSHWSLIGSPNMDNRSATLNVENIFAIEDRGFALTLEEEFGYLKNMSKEVLKDQFQPNIFKRIYYYYAYLLSKQF
jgi:cardiolipin synthase